MAGSFPYPSLPPMPDTPALPRRRFLGWNRPALDLVTEHLLQWQQRAPLEFCRATLVVPSAESGRRLREHMAERCAPRPLLMPRVCLAEQLMRPDPQSTASETETQAAWLAELEDIADTLLHEPSGSPWAALFPAPPMGKPAVWVEDTANMLRALRRRLEQECATQRYAEGWQQLHHAATEPKFRAYRERMGERWELLQRLWARVDARLRAAGRVPQEEAIARLLQAPAPFRGRVVLLCVPELAPQLRAYLARAIRSGAVVELWINAPTSERRNLDDWGQPLATWAQRDIPLPLETLHTSQDARALAQEALRLADDCTPQQVALVSCDRSLDAALCYHFAHPCKGEPWQLFVPSGRRLTGCEAARLPQLLRAAVEAQALEAAARRENEGALRAAEEEALLAVTALLRSGLWLRLMGCTSSPAGVAATLEQVQQKHLPAKTARLERLLAGEAPDVAAALRQTLAWLQRLGSAPQHNDAWRELAAALRRQTVPAVEALAAVAGDIAELGARQPCTPERALLLAEHGMEQALQSTAEPPLPKWETHADLLGWREAAFAAAPRLLLCGMHDGCLPEPPPKHAMLPEALSCTLGLCSVESRAARDAFLLTALLHSRPAGELHLLVAQQQMDGTPLQPSPLLLRARGRELAERASRLFADAPEPPPRPEAAATTLLPAREATSAGPESITLLGKSHTDNPYAAPDKPISPSTLNSFLRCPLRFWLRTLFKLNPDKLYPEDKVDLNASEYGTLLHKLLCRLTEQFPTADSLSRSADGALVAQQLLETAYEQSFGTSLSLPLRMQRELMGDSLRSFAALHEQELHRGWKVVAREMELLVTLDLGGDMPPARLSMTLDRVDYHPGEQRWRILDYKTHKNAPDAEHHSRPSDPARMEALLPELPLLLVRSTRKSSRHRWRNLQLPLYAYALQQLADEPPTALLPCLREHPEAREALRRLPLLAYINLPRNGAPATLTELHAPADVRASFDGEGLESALTWARALCRFLRRGECLLSAESLGENTPSVKEENLLSRHDPRLLCGLPALPTAQPTSQDA